MAGKKGMKALTHNDRLVIEALRRENIPVARIAAQIGVHRATIYNELKRGEYDHTKYDLTTEKRYSSDLGQQKTERARANRGRQLKIGKDHKYASYLEERILKDDMSPDAVLGELKVTGREKEFSTRVCTTTLYNYIAKGVFLTLTNKDLPVKGKKKRKYHKIRRQKRASAGTSIEKRPESVETREEFGHWEMDSVIGKQDESKNALVVLTERKTRKEIMIKAADHSSAEVVRIVNGLQDYFGELFTKVFKTITVDNGTEFSFTEQIERDKEGRKRLDLYYCHAYCSCERGSNENQNRMIRRKIPKGTNFDGMTDEEVKAVENWINNYPRRILQYRTSNQLFEEEISKLRNAA